MFIPVQIMGYLGTEALDNIYKLQLVSIQHISILCWVTLPGLLINSHLFGWNSIIHVFPRQPMYVRLSEMSCCLVHLSLLSRQWCRLQTSVLLTSSCQLCHLCETERDKGPVQSLQVRHHHHHERVYSALLQCGHKHRCITLPIRLNSVVNNQ